MLGSGDSRVVRRVRVIHCCDVGQHGRPDVIIVVGRDAHQLRAFDQKGRVADIADAHLIAFERRKLQSGALDRGRPCRDQARAALRHLRLDGRRRALRCGRHRGCDRPN